MTYRLWWTVGYVCTSEKEFLAAKHRLLPASYEMLDDALRRAAISALPDILPVNYNATFQQAQFLTNSPVLADLLKPANGNTTERLVALPDVSGRVREAFAAAYSRAPDEEEKASAEAAIQQAPQ